MNEDLGFYIVNGVRYESKIHALIEATKLGKKPRWVFSDDTFENFNWQQEPVESLDELYNQRARQLREKYDYLVLCYSGGSDSNNILEAFIRQGLLIDEVVTNFIVDATRSISNQNIASTLAENHNAEWDLLTKNRMQYIYDKMPGVKIKNFDMSRPILNHFKDHEDGSWILKCREWANPMSTTRYNVIHDITLRKEFDKDKSIGIILGVDKPQLNIRENHLALYFVDTTANITPISEHIKSYTNSTVEFFYWSPDSAKMLCKQAHVMLKWLRAFPQHRDLWNNSIVGQPEHPLFHQARNIKEGFLRNIIYTTWREGWFQAEKGTIGWTNVNDRWFFDHFKDSLEYRAWERGIDYLFANISTDFMMSADGKEGPLVRFKPMPSSFYHIGNLDRTQ